MYPQEYKGQLLHHDFPTLQKHCASDATVMNKGILITSISKEW